MEPIIREVSLEDTELLKKLYILTIMSEFPEYSEKKKEFFTSEKYVENMMHLPLRLGAFVDDVLVGYLLSTKSFGGIVFIHWIAVMEDYQHHGLGRKLLAKLEEIAKTQGAHGVHLEANKRNVSFYESMGFAQFGYTKHGYFDAEEYFMEKIIQTPKEENYIR